MSMHDIYVICKEHGTIFLAFVVVLMSIVQVTPIKLNPWSALFKWLSKAINGDLIKAVDSINTKVDGLSTKLNQHIEESDRKDLREQRESILDFASAVAEGKRSYTKEQYEQMLHECDAYATYCINKNFRNSVAEESIELIRQSYRSKIKHNSFLQIKLEED